MLGRSRQESGVLGAGWERRVGNGQASKLLDMNEIKLGSLSSMGHATDGPLTPGSRNIEAGDGKKPQEVVGS